ncbi:5-formyltetrahydrofolate cyclo-ligase [Methylocapsa acidiphila]|uniref:5-formyltetrahydrofolate cyclo-ligase n=1 Tax=Methylocapsa acidiphila TaxID=133552 RepID=UPI000420A046|nr:5-formyltetrahydrofolate cyclo-ligase [Methylocapsa acidiphila]
MPSSASKAALRAQALSRRAEESAETATALAAHLATAGRDLALRFQAPIVSAYFALPHEPSTLPLLEALSRHGVTTALPVTGARDAPLVFRQWRPGDPTVKGKMSIEEPLASAPEVDPDLLFVPLAAFDRSGHRIGYGAGFYDRTLARLRAMKRICAVGVAYASQALPKVPHEAHDERLDYVLTERELIDCRPSDVAS